MRQISANVFLYIESAIALLNRLLSEANRLAQINLLNDFQHEIVD